MDGKMYVILRNKCEFLSSNLKQFNQSSFIVICYYYYVKIIILKIIFDFFRLNYYTLPAV